MNQHRIGKPRATFSVDAANACAFEPFAPTGPFFHDGNGFVVQQHVMTQVLKPAQGGRAFTQASAAHRDVIRRQQFLDLIVWVLTEAEPDRDFPRFLAGVSLGFRRFRGSRYAIDRTRIARDSDCYVRIVLGKPIQTRDEPARREGVRSHDIERTMLFMPRAFNPGRETFQPLANTLDQRQAVFGELQRIGVALKKRDAKVELKMPDLLTDCGGRDVQFLRRLFEAQMAGSGFKGTKAGERRKLVRHDGIL